MAWTPKDSSYTDDSFVYQNPLNTGIGNFWGNMDRWRDISTGQRLTEDQVAALQNRNESGVSNALAGAWMDNGNPHGANNQALYDAMKGYLYKGKDGQNYMISGNYYHGGDGDQEGAHTAGDLMYGGVGALGHPELGRKVGEMSYSTTAFKPDWGGDMGAYNGSAFDMYDSKGKYVGSNIPTSMGDDQFAKHAAAMVAMVMGGAALAALGPAAGAAGGMGSSLGEGALAASGNFGLNAGTMGAAGANAAAAGAGGLGAAGSGAMDLGGGITMSPDGAIGGSSGLSTGGYSGAIPGLEGSAGGLMPTAPPANPFALGGGGTSGLGGFGSGTTNIPGIGAVNNSTLLQGGMSLLGALSGSKGQEQTSTTTKELPEYLQGPVAGAGGLIPNATWLMQQQLGNPGLLPPASKKKPKAKRGLL